MATSLLVPAPTAPQPAAPVLTALAKLSSPLTDQQASFYTHLLAASKLAGTRFLPARVPLAAFLDVDPRPSYEVIKQAINALPQGLFIEYLGPTGRRVRGASFTGCPLLSIISYSSGATYVEARLNDYILPYQPVLEVMLETPPLQLAAGLPLAA